MAKKINVKGPIVSNDTAWLYNYFGWDAASPNTITNGLKEAAGEDVIIEINSHGGVCVYGYEMYTAIMEYEGKVTVHVISAMSAATLIVCAADEALISDAGIFMIHNARSSADGDYRDMQTEADALREFNAGIINAYVRKTGKTRDEIQELMDKESYMSPQRAIELGFIDGYMFGDPNKKRENPEDLGRKIVAADIPIIPEDKARELMQLIANMKEVAPVQQTEAEEIGAGAVSYKPKEGGKKKMTLSEFLAENPEAQAEIDAGLSAARAEGQQAEKDRLQSLDAIAGTVKAEALQEAKYGKNPIDGPTLAYQAMIKGEQLAAAYMKEAMQDTAESGSAEVGIGNPDAGQEPDDEADELAAHVNKRKGGK